MGDSIRMKAHAIGATVDFNEIDAEDVFVDAPAYDALAAELAEWKRMRPLRRSSRLAKMEFASYLDFVIQKMAEHGIVIPDAVAA